LVELAANSIASTTTFTVAYTLSGTATAGADYSTTANLVAGGTVLASGVSGSFMIVQPASATAVSRTFGLLFGGNNDSLSEPEGTVVLTLTSVGPANSAHIDADRSQATYEIPPSDPVAASVAARFDAGVTMATEGGAGNAGMARFRISLSGAVSVPVAVEYALTGTAMRTAAADGVDAVQVTCGQRAAKHVTKPAAGLFAKAGVAPGRLLRDFRLAEGEGGDLAAGGEICADLFTAGQFVDVRGVTIGKGFAGVMKRYGYRGGRATHGNSKAHRLAGATGNAQDPGRIFKGKKMAGQMGGVRRVQQGLEVVRVDAARNLLLISGAVPGPKGADVLVRPSVKSGGKNAGGKS